MSVRRCEHWTHHEDQSQRVRCTQDATHFVAGSPDEVGPGRMLMCDPHAGEVADEYREKLGWELGPWPLKPQDREPSTPLLQRWLFEGSAL